MSVFKFSTSMRIGALLLVASAAAPALAITTFAQFNQEDAADVVVYNNMGASASFSFIPSAVFFDVLAFGPLGTYSAILTGSAITSDPFVIAGPLGTRTGWSGTFSFDDGGTNYLTVSFTNAVLTGIIGGTSAGFLASTPDSTISYSSDVINVSSLVPTDFSLSITGLFPSYGSGSATYSGELTGGFAAMIPEPATWLMLIAGFGLVGTAARHRRTSRTLLQSA